MKIVFLDLGNIDYNVETPHSQPLSGSQSMICYLAENLVKLGHEIYLINNLSKGGIYRGVSCLSYNEINVSFFLTVDIVILQNRPAFGFTIKNLISSHCLLILWLQHAQDQPAVECLLNAELVNIYDQIVLISQWQKDQYLKTFPISPEKVTILNNAISPNFAQLFRENEQILSHKINPPVLAYTSTPFRGLDLLLEFFPYIKKLIPEITLKVFSSMQVYQINDESKYAGLYEKCQNMEGVEYIGSISQKKLAEELKSVSILSYPNTFPETSCIAVMEAMASGCYIITSDLGALGETSANFGSLLAVDDNDWNRYGEVFILKTVEILQQYLNEDYELENHLRKQVDFVNYNYGWKVRTQEWINFLTKGKFQQFLKEEKYQEAVDFFEREININPLITDNYWYLGLSFLFLGDIITAQTTWFSILFNDSTEIIENNKLELLDILQTQIKELWKLERDDLRELLENTIKDVSC
ncbi:putative glycosyl-transferase [Geminocystis sp. NIES-3708]|uniref:glycosyltransferase family 4 protein n=1 Tax=Geminocystis sp. NIES-3708 TaxID=1615909 RepID=UPI0005FC7C27|nr:glycosyltransferase family 4 protein [Geminocystis sp. NIES-3708]BAQ61051.1 putative glycosyl-transferase [Geminocystis sp. NIES-3708]